MVDRVQEIKVFGTGENAFSSQRAKKWKLAQGRFSKPASFG